MEFKLETEAKAGQKKTVKILVVDDDPSNVALIEDTLAPLNESVVQANSGKETLKRCLDDAFAVILLDVNMPDMDGFETAALIRTSKKSVKTPIIFVTGYAEDYAEIMKGYSQGAVDYIIKPYNADILCSKVKVFVDLFRMQQELASEIIKRRSVEEQQRSLDVFMQQFNSGQIEAQTERDFNQHIVPLLNQSLVQQNARLQAQLRQLKQRLS